MDNLTHSLFALTLARTPLKRAGAGTTAALVIASNAPDIDIIAAFTGGSSAYLALHRGPTHGLFGIAGLAAATAAIVWLWQRMPGLARRDGSGGTKVPACVRATQVPPYARAADTRIGAFPQLLAVSGIGTTLHVLMDLPTSYGTRLLSPLSDTWFAFDWMPIIDVYLLAVLACGLGALHIRPRAERPIACAVLLLMLANYGFRAVAHAQTLARVGHTRPILELESWPGDDVTSVRKPCVGQTAPPRSVDTSDDCQLVAAIPTFQSPFEWRAIRRLNGGYEVAAINLLEMAETRPAAAWYPDEDGPWIERARETRAAQVFLRFARFPAARLVDESSTEAAVRLEDVRFASGPVRVEVGSPPPRSLFVVTIRIARDGRILEERLGS